MDKTRIDELFAAMADKPDPSQGMDGGINNFIMGDVLDSMVSRGLQAVAPALEAAHDALAAMGGAVTLDGGERVAIQSPPQGPHSGVWRKALSLGAPAGSGRPALLVSLHLDGEPDPEMDAIMAGIMDDMEEAASVMTLPESETETSVAVDRDDKEPQSLFLIHPHGLTEEIRVYACKDTEAMDRLLDFDAQDRGKWSRDLIVESRMAYRDGEGTWSEQHRSTISGVGLEEWPRLFDTARRLFDATGTADRFAAIAAEVATRRWSNSSQDTPGLEQYAASRAFSSELVAEDGFLPGAACIEALDGLDSRSATMAMLVISDACTRIVAGMQARPDLLDEDGSFDCNDLDDWTRILERGEDSFVVEVRTQNRVHVVSRTGTEWIVTATAPDTPDVECLRLGFVQEEDGSFSMSGVIGQDREAIHSWNGARVSIPGVAASLEAEARFVPDP